MGRLLYSAIMSLDGYIADENGNFDWAQPDEEVHTFINELERRVGTYLYGRQMYEVMVAWETMDVASEPSCVKEYAQIWRATDKIVFSKTLDSPSSPRTRIERNFDPSAVRELKTRTESDISIGGSNLAGQVIKAGLVDEWHFFMVPVVVGGGKQALPDGTRLFLQLVDQSRFDGGTVYLHYRSTSV